MYLKNNQYHYANLESDVGMFTKLNDELIPIKLGYSEQYMIYIYNNKPYSLCKHYNTYTNNYELNQSKLSANYEGIIVNPFIIINIEINNPTELQTSMINIILSNGNTTVETYRFAIDPIDSKVYSHTIISYKRYNDLKISTDTAITGNCSIQLTYDTITF